MDAFAKTIWRGRGMTKEEAEIYAQSMSFKDAIYNLMQAKSVPYRKATFIKIKELFKTLEQEPFINKPCVSEKACEHDKQMVLDKIRAEIKALSPEPTAYDVVDGNSVKDAVWEILIEVDKIIDKYRAESEDTE